MVLQKIFDDLIRVAVDTDRTVGDLFRRDGITVVDARVGGVRILQGDVDEGVFDDGRGVILIEHRFACFLCRAIVILLYTAVSDRRDIVTGFAADVTDESVINIDLHNNLAVLLFLFMDHDAINQRMQQFFG